MLPAKISLTLLRRALDEKETKLDAAFNVTLK